MPIPVEILLTFDDKGAVTSAKRIGAAGSEAGRQLEAGLKLGSEEAKKLSAELEKARKVAASGAGFREFGNEVRGIADRLEPARIKLEQFKLESQKLHSAFSSGQITGERYKSLMSSLTQEFRGVGTAGQSLTGQIGRIAAGFLTAQVAMQAATRGFAELKQGIIGAAGEQRQIAGLQAIMRDFGMDVEKGTEKIEHFSRAMQLSGIEDDKTREALQRMLPITKDLDSAIQAVNVAYGISIKRNVDVSTSLETMAALMVGSERALVPAQKTFGVVLDENTPKAAQMQSALDQLSKAAGNTATTTRDATAAIGSFGIMWDESWEGVGSKVLPGLQDLNEGLAEVGLKLSDLPGKIAQFAPALVNLNRLGRAVKRLVYLKRELTGATDDVGLAVKRLGVAMSDAELMALTLSNRDEELALRMGETLMAEKEMAKARAAGAAALKKEIEDEINWLKGLEEAYKNMERIKKMAAGVGLLDTAPTGGGGPIADTTGAASGAPIAPSTLAGPAFDASIAELQNYLEKVKALKAQYHVEGMVIEAEQLAEVKLQEEMELAALLAMREAEFISDRMYQDEKTRIVAEAEAKRAGIERDTAAETAAMKKRMQNLQMAQDLSAAGQSLMQLGAHNKTLFRMGKAAALAGATVSIAQGIADALKMGFPMGLIAGIAVAAAGAVQIAAITSAKPPAYAQGTPYIPETGLAVMHKGEAVIPAEYNPFSGGGGRSGASAPAQPMTVNLDFSRAYINDQATAAAVATMVEGAIKRGHAQREVA